MSYILNSKWARSLWYLAKDIEDAKKENDLEKVEVLKKKWKEISGSEYK